MPSLGSGLSLGTLNKLSGVDYDVSAYFQTAGITNATARSQINTFALGLKSLGLWDTSICWMLKSSLNAGTGSVVYSFGGLGSYNGSLVNSPTWGSTGISFTSTNQQINLPDDANLYNLRTGFFVFNSGSGADNQRLIEIQDNATLQGWYCLFRYGGGVSEAGLKYLATRNSTQSYNGPSGQLASQNSFQTSAFTANNTSDNLFRDGSLISGSARTGLPSLNPTGGRVLRQLFANSSSMVGTFGFISTATLTNAQISSLHSLYVSAFASNRDLDADAYIVRAGVTDPTAQTQINDFVAGAKSLGIWNNMVCWPLRSSQNAGTGATAYSLGGLATANGTLTNGPTWGTDGVNFVTASNTRIVTPAIPFSNSLSVFNVFLHTAFGASSGDYSATIGVDQSYQLKGAEDFITGSSGSRSLKAWIYRVGGQATDLNVSIPNDSAFLNTFHALGVSASSTNNATLYDGTATNVTQSTPVVASSAVGIGAQGVAGGRVMTGKISFTLLSSTGFTASQFSSLYTLYKTTLGTGLGLP